MALSLRRVIANISARRKRVQSEAPVIPQKFLRHSNAVNFETDRPRALENHTVISPPHNVSNLRTVYLRTPKDETQQEQAYRKAHEDLQLWNHHYWINHNELFQQKRSRFVTENSPTKETQPDANTMAVFYKQFLNEHSDKHWRYNLEWYRRHTALLPVEFRARWSRLRISLLSYLRS